MKVKEYITISLLIAFCTASSALGKGPMPEVKVCPQSMSTAHKENIRDCAKLGEWKINMCPGFCQFQGDKNLYATQISVGAPELKKIEKADAVLHQLKDKLKNLQNTNKEMPRTSFQAGDNASEPDKKAKTKLKNTGITTQNKIKATFTKNLKKAEDDVKKEEDKKAKSASVPILCEIKYMCTFVAIPVPNFTTTRSDEGSNGELSKSSFPQKPESNNESKKGKEAELAKLAANSKAKK